MGTVVAIPFAIALAYLSPIAALVFTFVFVLFSMFIAQLYENKLQTHDAKEIVIDEIAGYFIAVIWLPLTWQTFVFGFVLFRLFDILKPFPISYIDKKIDGGVGVVLDDVLAGVMASLLLQVAYNKTDWLGVQLGVAS